MEAVDLMQYVLWPQYPSDPPPDGRDNESVRENVWVLGKRSNRRMVQVT